MVHFSCVLLWSLIIKIIPKSKMQCFFPPPPLGNAQIEMKSRRIDLEFFYFST